eukprot:7224704-Prymnesium_polylepis.1
MQSQLMEQSGVLGEQSWKKWPVQEGFLRASIGSVQALRVPFEDFAAELTTADGQKVAFLKLVVNAVTATHNYSVFGKQLIRILVVRCAGT